MVRLMKRGNVIPMLSQNQTGMRETEMSFSKKYTIAALVKSERNATQLLSLSVAIKKGSGETKANKELWKKSEGRKKIKAQRNFLWAFESNLFEFVITD